jgi:hypothetical protein
VDPGRPRTGRKHPWNPINHTRSVQSWNGRQRRFLTTLDEEKNNLAYYNRKFRFNFDYFIFIFFFLNYKPPWSKAREILLKLL